MGKTKRELRAEAVERLNGMALNTGSAVRKLAIALGVKWNPDNAPLSMSVLQNRLRDLLTDDEPPEGDAVAILRKAASYDGDYSNSSEALRRLTGTTTVYYALEKLADMVERDYVRREEYDNEREALLNKLVAVDDAFNDLKAEHNGLKALQNHVMSERNQAIAERDEWKAKAESALHENPYVGLVRGKQWERTEISDYYCGRCGWKVTDHDSYCPECGGALHGGSNKVRAGSSDDGAERSNDGVTAEYQSGVPGITFVETDVSKIARHMAAHDANADTREKLEADVRRYANPTNCIGSIGACWEKKMIGFLDRQEAIVDREMQGRITDLQKQVDELEAERDCWRSSYGEVMDAVDEVRRIADTRMPKGNVTGGGR